MSSEHFHNVHISQNSPASCAGETQSHMPNTKDTMMAENPYEEAYDNFLKTFRSLAPYKHRYDVFRDFVTMSAISLRNAIFKDDVLEEEYLRIIHSYRKPDQQKFPELLGLLIQLLEHEPKDVLGSLYMGLELKSKDKGQFFTPAHICDLMSEMVHDADLEHIDKPFMTVSDPCCGGGGMVLAFVKMMISHGHNPAEKLWVECIDIDRMVALMCYIQLTLWNVPAEVIVGNTLSLEVRETWYTPAHILGNWNYKLAKRAECKEPEQTSESGERKHGDVSDASKSEPLETSSQKPRQFDFGF